MFMKKTPSAKMVRDAGEGLELPGHGWAGPCGTPMFCTQVPGWRLCFWPFGDLFGDFFFRFNGRFSGSFLSSYFELGSNFSFTVLPLHTALVGGMGRGIIVCFNFWPLLARGLWLSKQKVWLSSFYFFTQFCILDGPSNWRMSLFADGNWLNRETFFLFGMIGWFTKLSTPIP